MHLSQWDMEVLSGDFSEPNKQSLMAAIAQGSFSCSMGSAWVSSKNHLGVIIMLVMNGNKVIPTEFLQFWVIVPNKIYCLFQSASVGKCNFGHLLQHFMILFFFGCCCWSEGTAQCVMDPDSFVLMFVSTAQLQLFRRRSIFSWVWICCSRVICWTVGVGRLGVLLAGRKSCWWCRMRQGVAEVEEDCPPMGQQHPCVLRVRSPPALRWSHWWSAALQAAGPRMDTQLLCADSSTKQ